MILLALAFATPMIAGASAVDTQLFFHWGDAEGNAKLLELGGYPSPSGSAQFNEPVLKQIREWYNGARRRDLAGAGFYFSPSPTNSSDFGFDLLVVEANNRSPLTHGLNPGIVSQADEALDHGDFSKLPLVSLFREDTQWHVLSRAPTAHEAQATQIRFRPVERQDIPRIWQKIVSSPDPQTLAAGMSAIASKTLRPASNAAQLVVRELVFQNVPGQLTAPFVRALFQPDPSGLYPGLGHLRNIFRALDQETSARPAVDRIFPEAMRLFHDLSGPFKDLNVIEYTVQVFDRLSPPEKLAAIQSLVRGYPGEKGPNLISLSQYMKELYLKVDTHGKELIRQWALAAASHAMASLRDLSNALAQFIPRSEAEAAALNLVGQNAEALIAALMEDPKVSTSRSEKLFASTDAARSLESYAQFLATESQLHAKPRLQAMAETLTRQLLARISPEERAMANRDALLLQLLPAVQEKSLHAELIHAIEQRLAEAKKGHRYAPFFRRNSHNLFSGYFEKLVDQQQSHPPFVVRQIHEFLHAWPAYGNEVAEGLAFAKQRARFGGSYPIAWSSLIREARREAAKHQSPDALAADLHAALQYEHDRPDANTRLPLQTELAQSLRRSLLTIPESAEYSELSRTFNLVDPLLVSEDIRLTSARRPFERFNEELSLVYGQKTQPAWDNFLEAWDEFSQSIWALDANPASAGSGYFDNPLYNAHETLLATNVDGVREPETVLWDRSKYTTVIPDQEWKDWKLEESRSRLARFFEIEKVPEGYSLKFLDEPGLRRTAPGINRYSARNHNSPLPLRLLAFIHQDSRRIRDPAQRAARILYLMTRLHPIVNGNGRLGRLWAAMHLLRNGYPMPVGFPTSDFAMSQRQIELEVRRSTKLGELWEKMIRDASARGVAPDDFFQKVFRGSALEGLMHISPRDPEELASYVEWLHRQKQAPEWAADYMRKVEKRLYELHSAGGRIAQLDELQRARLLQEEWDTFRGEASARGIADLPRLGRESGTPCWRLLSEALRN